MVYSSDILTTSFTTQTNNSPQPAVAVRWNGSGIHEIAGPTPFVDIGYVTERNGAGGPEVITTKITLTGKIVRTGNPGTLTTFGSGVTPVVTGINQLKQLFTQNDFGILSITCAGAPTSNSPPGQIFAATGVRVMSMDFSKTADNWVTTADYTIVLEANESAISGFSVKGTVDSWNIEPLEEYTYASYRTKIKQKQEYHNPNMKPTAPSASSPQPAGSNSASNNGRGATSSADADLDIISIPQFKVSRTVSAIGVPSGSGNFAQYSTYLNAKKWVDYRLSYGISSYSTHPGQTGATAVTGLISIGPAAPSNNITSPWPHLSGNGFLYNHLRSINFSITEAKYEVTDTWLAMPTGIKYVEDYSVEMSTDEKYIHTVRVQGEIKGLSMVSPAALTGSPGLVNETAPTKMDLTYSSGLISGSLPTNQKLLDIKDQDSPTTNNFFGSKYENAVSGWLNDIKPYLYRRACLVMNSKDRTVPYISPSTTPQPPPNNPMYSTLGLLNIIPTNTSEGHDPRKGSITYSYEFNNKFTIISGVISENITVSDTGPTDVIGEAFVLGRALGPILQNLGTRTSSSKEVSIEVLVVPPSSLKGFFMQNNDCPLWTGGTVFKTITGIIEGLKPFGDRPHYMFGTPTVGRSLGQTNVRGQVFVKGDNVTWEPTNGRFVKTVSWIYQQCSNDKNWMDH